MSSYLAPGKVILALALTAVVLIVLAGMTVAASIKTQLQDAAVMIVTFLGVIALVVGMSYVGKR